MDNLDEQIVDERFEEGFKISTDELAEWSICKISEDKFETQRLISICQTRIDDYNQKIEKYKTQLENKTTYLKEHLRLYFITVPHSKSKTQESYKLPSGTLKLKQQKPEFVQDKEIFLKWLNDNSKTDFIETTQNAKWGEFKKVCTVSGSKVLSADGEIVDGVVAVDRPSEFVVEV